MDRGTYISGAGHVALIGWLLIGPVFTAEPLPMQVSEVSIISEAEFAAMTAAQQSPQLAAEVSLPQAEPDAPEVQEVVPEPEPEAAARVDTPQVTQTPVAEDVPDVPEPPAPAQVDESVAELSEPSSDVAVLAPEVAPRPIPRPAERVAPEPVVRPNPEAEVDPVEQEAVEQSDEGETPREPQEATAPEETAPEIVTEADEPSGRMTSSLRPPARRPTPPARPVETAEPAAEPSQEPAEDSTADAVANAVAEAISGGEPEPRAAPSGPPLTGGEKEGLRVAVSSCWNVGALSSEAQETKVTVFVEMGRDGKPVGSSIRMLSSTGGSDGAAKRVFDTARRAIIRCGAKGFPLPVEKYDHWREIEMTFNPEGMFY